MVSSRPQFCQQNLSLMAEDEGGEEGKLPHADHKGAVGEKLPASARGIMQKALYFEQNAWFSSILFHQGCQDTLTKILSWVDVGCDNNISIVQCSQI